MVEARGLVDVREVVSGRVPVGRLDRRRVAADHKLVVERLAKHPKIALAAHFPGEAAAGLERSEYPCRDRFLVEHPVQCRIGENGVELGVEMHVRGIDGQRIQALRAGCADHVEAVVDPGHLGPALGDFLRQHPVAAADVEDPLAGLRVEQIERRHSQLGHERTDPGIIRRIPAAGRGGRLAQSVFTQSR